MDTIIAALGKPTVITQSNSHRWVIKGHLFCVMPRETKNGTVFLFNVRDEKGTSVRAGCWDDPKRIIEAAPITLRAGQLELF